MLPEPTEQLQSLSFHRPETEAQGGAGAGPGSPEQDGNKKQNSAAVQVEQRTWGWAPGSHLHSLPRAPRAPERYPSLLANSILTPGEALDVSGGPALTCPSFPCTCFFLAGPHHALLNQCSGLSPGLSTPPHPLSLSSVQWPEGTHEHLSQAPPSSAHSPPGLSPPSE